MIYVMECGPVPQGLLESWVVFALNPSTRQVTTHIAPTRTVAREATAEQLRGLPVECCEALGPFGRAHGWQVRPVPPDVGEIVCVTLTSLEQRATLGPLAFTPLIEAWLSASAMFLEAAPWRTLTSTQALEARVDGKRMLSRVLAVTGRSRVPPGLIMLPNQAAFDRAQSPGADELDDVVVLTLDDETGPVSRAMQRQYGRAFHPLLLRLQQGRVSTLSENDFKLLIASMRATTSLALGAPIGRGGVGDVEVTVARVEAASRNDYVH